MKPFRERLRRIREGYVGRPGHSLVASFNYAFEGIVWCLATQRNMRIHFVAATAVLIAGVVLGVTRFELALLAIVCGMVIVAEMLNTAVEAAIDTATSEWTAVAKVAKDVAAGAVLVAAAISIIVGYLVLAPRLQDPSAQALVAVRDSEVHITIVVLAVTILAAIAMKVLYSRGGTPVRGGFPSGHAAVAFAAWMSVTLISADSIHALEVSAVTFLLAALVAQTRVEAGIHTFVEVAAGAVLGSVVALLIFQIVDVFG